MTEKIIKDLEILTRTPAIVTSMVEGLTDAWTQVDEGEGTWNAYEIVGHFVFGEETDWIPRAQIILEHGEARPFTPFDRTGFVKYIGKPISELLSIFHELRKKNVEKLKEMNLTDEQLELTGVHPEFGQVTLGQLISAWVVHDLGHIAQIARVMAKVHKDSAGPWAKYLPILD